MKSILVHSYEDLISIDNLLSAWQEFVKGKRNKHDVQIFSFNLMDNIIQLHEDLKNHTYKHGTYQEFKINDPKPRTIHKASVRDRLLHHAVYRILYPFFDKTFIADSFSCRDNKGTHRALNRFERFVRKVSKNNTRPCWVLKYDIKKFFASVDQQTLIKILEEYICLDSRGVPLGSGNDTLDLLKEIIFSFKLNGLPLGNLTSQLFANVYLNELDQFVKQGLKAKYYIRYADDFLFLSRDKKRLEYLLPGINDYLQNKLKLNLHPDKIFINTIYSGVDFLGWVNFADHRILRAKTRKRMLKRIKSNSSSETSNSYLGLLKHGNCCRIKESILNNTYNKII